MFYIPRDAQTAWFERTMNATRPPTGDASYYTIKVGDRPPRMRSGVTRRRSREKEIEGHLAFYPNRVDKRTSA